MSETAFGNAPGVKLWPDAHLQGASGQVHTFSFLDRKNKVAGLHATEDANIENLLLALYAMKFDAGDKLKKAVLKVPDIKKVNERERKLAESYGIIVRELKRR